MFRRFRFAMASALLLALVLVIPAFAGGWAVITLDELPSNVVAGEPLSVGFTVLQHGRTPMTDLHPTITANLDKEQEFVVDAEAEGKPGHYAATLTFPRDGNWRWSIQAFTMDQAMPMLSVATPPAGSASPLPSKTNPAISFTSKISIAGLLVLAGALVGAVISFQRRNRQMLGLTALSLLFGITLFIVGAGTASRAEAQAGSISPVEVTSSISQEELGSQLFIAKGCITCHVNSKAGSPSDYWTIEMGAPDLSKFSANPEVISMRLKDPASVKSDTKMPNLDLSKGEIEALVAFINSK